MLLLGKTYQFFFVKLGEFLQALCALVNKKFGKTFRTRGKKEISIHTCIRNLGSPYCLSEVIKIEDVVQDF